MRNLMLVLLFVSVIHAFAGSYTFTLDNRVGVRRAEDIEKISYSTGWNDGSKSVKLFCEGEEIALNSDTGVVDVNMSTLDDGVYTFIHDDGVSPYSASFVVGDKSIEPLKKNEAIILLDTLDSPRKARDYEIFTYSSNWNTNSTSVSVFHENKEIHSSSADGVLVVNTKSWKNGLNTFYHNDGVETLEASFIAENIVDFSSGELSINIGNTNLIYNGKEQTLDFVLSYKDTTGINTILTNGVHYVVEYDNNIDANRVDYVPTMTITGIGGYEGTFETNFVINPRSVTLTSASKTWTYDGAVHSVQSVQADGFVDGQGASYSDFASIVNVGSCDNTFKYTLNANTLASNYDINVVNGTLKVNKASLTGDDNQFADNISVVIDPTEFVYDATAHEPVVTMSVGYDSGVTNTLVQGVDYTVTYANNIDANRVDYVPTMTISGIGGYEGTFETNFVINPCSVTLISATQTWTYDGAVHSAQSVQADGFVDGQGAEYSDFASILNVGSCDNTFKYTLNANTLASNYDIDVVNGKLTINARVVGDNSNNWDIRLGKNPLYDGEEKQAPITQVAYIKADGNLENIAYKLEGNVATNAGNYVVKIRGTGNYTGTIQRDWAITPRTVSLTSGLGTWVYDGSEHSVTTVDVGGDGFVQGEGVDYSNFPVVKDFADAATPIQNSFEYSFKANTLAKNYVITTSYGTLAMLRRQLILTSPTKNKSYDGVALSFTGDEIVAGGQGFAQGECFAFGNFASIVNAGQTASTFTYNNSQTAKLDNYTVTTEIGTLTVAKSATEIVVQANSSSWVYDGQSHTNHTWTATNLDTLQPGDELVVEFDPASVVTLPTDGSKQDGVIANTITSVKVIRNGEIDVTDNYSISFYPGTLTVTKRNVVITSLDASRSYDGTALVKHEVQISGDGFVDGQGASYEFTGEQLEKGSSENKFTYMLNAGTQASNYEINVVFGTLEITALDISAVSEEEISVVLGPALTYTGLEQNQTVASVMCNSLVVDYSVLGNQATDAGDYNLTITGQGNFTGSIIYPWEILPKALTLTAGSGSKVYDGTALMVNDVKAEGFVANQSAVYTCDGAQIDVGSSPNNVATIIWAENTKESNYAVTKIPGELTVTPRSITLTAPTKTKPYDGSSLSFNGSEIKVGGLGFASGEGFVYSNFSSIIDAGQIAATFSYDANQNTKLSNYNVTKVDGTLTIAKSATEIVVQADSASWEYDGNSHTKHTWTATNLDTLQPGDELVVEFAPSSVVTLPTDGSNHDGVVPNTISSIKVIRNGEIDVTANYSMTGYPGTLTVTKRKVSVNITGNNADFTFDGTEKSVDGYTITTDDEMYDVATMTKFVGTSSISETNVGIYQMGLTASDFVNTDEYFDVVFNVVDGYLTINALDISNAIAGDFVAILGENPKYNGVLQTIDVKSVTYKGLPLTYTLTGDKATHAGQYLLTFTANGNFIGEQTVTWNIQKREVTFTSGSDSKIYDGTPLTNNKVVISQDGFIGLEGALFTTSGSQTIVGKSANTFTYELKAGTLASDYTITCVEGELEVTKANYDIAGGVLVWNADTSAISIMYDGIERVFEIANLPNGVTAEYSQGCKGKDVGKYTASVVLNYDTHNYNQPQAPASFEWEITPRDIILTAANKDKPYDGFPLSVIASDITASGSGYALGECFTYGDFASITDVGETPATFSYTDSDTAKVSNYNVTTVDDKVLKVTVGVDQISVTAANGTWAYDGTEHRTNAWSIVNADKLLPGDVFDIKLSEDSYIIAPDDGIDGNGIVSNSFEYVRIIRENTGANVTKNYNLFVYDGVLTVTNANMVVSPEKYNITKQYDGVAAEIPLTVDSVGLLQSPTFTFGTTSEDISSLENPSYTHAGEYEVWYTINAKYYNTYTNKADIVINKRPITLCSPTKSKNFDGIPLTFDASEISISNGSFVSGEGFAYSNFAQQTDAGRTSSTFDYVAKNGTDINDYDVSIQNGTLTVNASAEQITVTAKDGSWIFDGNSHSLHEYYVENEDVLLSTDKLVVSFSPDSVITTPKDGNNGVVENIITDIAVMRNGTEDVTKNYSIVSYSGLLHMSNASIDCPVPDTKEYVYDGNGHSTSVDVPQLLTNPVVVKYSSSQTGPYLDAAFKPVFTNAGTYAVWYTIEAEHYNTYTNSAKVIIAPREITLVSASATRDYDGTPLKNESVSIKQGSLDFVAGQGASYSNFASITDVGGVDNVFEYTLNANTLADNYTIKKGYGTLRISPATLTENQLDSIFDDYVGVYDSEGHTISVNNELPNMVVYYALVPGDESAFTTTAPMFTNVVDTPVNVYSKLMAPNYNAAYVTNQVIITKAELNVTANSKTILFGEEPSNNGVVYTGFVGRENEEVLDGSLDYAYGTYQAGSSVGDYPITPLGLSSGNYEITFVNGVLSVEQYSINSNGVEIKAIVPKQEADANGNHIYDGKAKTLDIEIISNINGVTRTLVEGVDYKLEYLDNVNASSSSNKPKVIITGIGNYSGEKTILFDIKPRAVTLTSANASFVYDGKSHSNESVAVTGDGFVGNDGAEYSSFATITNVGEVKNTFTYKLKQGTIASNYNVSVVYGKLLVKPVGLDTIFDIEDDFATDGSSYYDSSFEYDGAEHTINTNLLFAIAQGTDIDLSFSFALEKNGKYQSAPFTYVDAGTYTFWYKISSANYNDYIHQATVTITKRPLTKNMIVMEGTSFEWTGLPVVPSFYLSDIVNGVDIIKNSDWNYTLSNNINHGTKALISVVASESGNYTGSFSQYFNIIPKIPTLEGTIGWRYNQGTGTFFAQLNLLCTDGNPDAVEDVWFYFEDRVTPTRRVQLWNTKAGQPIQDTMIFRGSTFRWQVVPSAAEAIRSSKLNTPFVAGVKDINTTSVVVPVAERMFELYAQENGKIMEKSQIEKFICYLAWSSSGKTNFMQIGASSVTSELVSHYSDAPRPVELVNNSLAFGVSLNAVRDYGVKFKDIAINPDGTLDMQMATFAGYEEGIPGPNATLKLLGTSDLSEPFTELGTVNVDSLGGFSFKDDAQQGFYKLILDYNPILE